MQLENNMEINNNLNDIDSEKEQNSFLKSTLG